MKNLSEHDFRQKTVLLRVDFNVPINKENGEISDTTRIKAALATINELIERDCKLVILTHFGRPKGEIREDLRVNKIAKKLAELIGRDVKYIDDCIGQRVKDEVKKMQFGDVLLLENVRFYKEEREKESSFVDELAELGEIFVSDAFGVVHRDHASTSGLAEKLESYAGFLLEKEIEVLTKLRRSPKKPLTLVMGGAKIDTKIGILRNFINKADNFIIGGGLANTFLAAKGYNIGQSLYQEDKLELAKEIMYLAEKSGVNFMIPQDVVVAKEISKNAETLNVSVENVDGDMKILDLGLKSLNIIEDIIKASETIVWNGPVGLFEYEPFAEGTRRIANLIADSEVVSIVGGGDSIEAIDSFGIDKKQFTHISTGGGAMLEFLEGKELLGIKALS